MDYGSHVSLDLWILIIYILDITNGGFQSTADENTASVNLTTTSFRSTSTSSPITKIIAVTSKATNYEILSDDTSSQALTQPTIISEPYFDAQTPRNVTGLVGKSSYLSCRVRNLGNKTVSWIRHRDIHILTVGSYTYTSDQRFQATHHKENDEWTLQIKWAQKRDGGVYECQISTQPVRSYFVNLNIVVPTATILGGPDLHFDKGSTINLTCTIKYSPEPPAYIFWYHHDEVISYDSQRGGVSVITEKGDITTSYLLIQNADLADSGRYSCSPSNADVASVLRALISGEHPEAMQTGSCGKSPSYYIIISLMLLIILSNIAHKELFLSLPKSSLELKPSHRYSHAQKSSTISPRKYGLSSTAFLINFKLESTEGVGKQYQSIFTHPES
ncbi:CLUMA_CG016979, isoform A [Clunio marinus]|uniref:CLUMA_CG016979, isoform A n=1 Tax=Clunio marinus TaxID=568069 RepID=A0A1J1IZ33_9DIPT|nr:CLUMA_CG016979, isoform A [Clunio marinus]